MDELVTSGTTVLISKIIWRTDERPRSWHTLIARLG